MVRFIDEEKSDPSIRKNHRKFESGLCRNNRIGRCSNPTRWASTDSYCGSRGAQDWVSQYICIRIPLSTALLRRVLEPFKLRKDSVTY